MLKNVLSSSTRNSRYISDIRIIEGPVLPGNINISNHRVADGWLLRVLLFMNDGLKAEARL